MNRPFSQYDTPPLLLEQGVLVALALTASRQSAINVKVVFISVHPLNLFGNKSPHSDRTHPAAAIFVGLIEVAFHNTGKNRTIDSPRFAVQIAAGGR